MQVTTGFKLTQEGNFGQTSLLRLLYNIYLAGTSGVMEVKENSFSHKIYFDKGNTVAISLGYEYAMLGEMLLERGKISKELHSRILLESERCSKCTGQLLIEAGVITQEELEKQYLVEQVMQRLGRLCMTDDASFVFYEGNIERPEFAASINTLKTIFYISKYFKTPQQLEEQEKKYDNKLISPRTNLNYVIPAMELDNFILQALKSWNQSRSIIDITTILGMNLRETLGLIETLELLDTLDIIDKPEVRKHVSESEEESEQEQASGEKTPSDRSESSAQQTAKSSTQSQKAKASEPSADMQALIQEVRAFNRISVSKNAINILGVKRDASPKEIRNAYVKLTRKYHPDHVSMNLSTEIRREFEKASAAVNEAYSRLTNEEKRKQFFKLLDDPVIKGDLRKAEMRQRASLETEQGFIMTHKNNFAQAIKHLKRALMIFPYDPINYARLGWCLFNTSAPGENNSQKALEAIDKGLEIHPENEFGNHYKAKILLALKKSEEAEKYYIKAVKANPNNYEAKRDLKILRRRLGKDPDKF